jgi:hypothetical protein
MRLSKERIGKFTASIGYHLIPGPRGGTATRDKCIQKRAEEIVTGFQEEFFSRPTEHGKINEFEAGEEFTKLTGLIIESNNQTYMPIDENSGATPDFLEKDFNDIIIATVDTKCPFTKFFEQKMMIINESKPEYQNSPLSMFVQAQMQMRAATVFNAKLGHPPVLKHHLVRYLTSSIIDDDGMKIEIDLPIESRMFWKVITFDEVFYNTKIQPNIDTAADERDLLVKIFKQPII